MVDEGSFLITRLSRYACVVHGLNIQRKNIGVASIIGSHASGETNQRVELIQFQNETMFYLLHGIGKFFRKLKSIYVGCSDLSTLGTKLIRRSNFQNMENLFELVIHKSDIDKLYEDTLWDLQNLERFQLDGKLKVLYERTFEKNPKLREVYLASNKLEFLPRYLFKNNPLLDWVNFEDNSLKIIETNFTGLKNIKYIFLRNNVCIDALFNRTVNVDHETQFYRIRKVTDFQSLIWVNCSSANIKVTPL